MDIFCYGSPRELLVYIITMSLAGSAAYATSVAIAKLGPSLKTIKDSSPFIVFIVFAIAFYFAIQFAFSTIDDACGFVPDYEGAKRDREIIYLEKQIDDARHRLEYLR